MERTAGVDVDGDLVRVATGAALLGPLHRRRLRAVVDPVRVEGEHALGDAGPTEELAPVVEDDLVHVDVAVVERHAEGIGIAFERTGAKVATTKPLPTKVVCADG